MLNRVRAKLGELPARWFSRRSVPFTGDERFVSITFDDYPVSAIEAGGPILADEGVAATFYVAFGLASSETPVGYVGSAADLASCTQFGHEIGCHTYDHYDCATTPPDDIDASLRRNQAAAETAGVQRLQHFAFPFGRYSLGAKRVILQRYVTARIGGVGVNRGDIDFGMLKSAPLYARDGVAGWKPCMQELERAPGWLIIRTHDVAASPSEYGCTPRELLAVIQAAKNCRARILPVGAVVDHLIGSSAAQGRPFAAADD